MFAPASRSLLIAARSRLSTALMRGVLMVAHPTVASKMTNMKKEKYLL
jgi:hypothetical protein